MAKLVKLADRKAKREVLKRQLHNALLMNQALERINTIALTHYRHECTGDQAMELIRLYLIDLGAKMQQP